MAEEAAAHHLLNVLEERELNVDLDNVLAAFEDEQTKKEAAAWVNENLTEDTLLTREELELYQTLQKKGLLHHYEDTDDGNVIRPVRDHELDSAINSLESSTAAIEEQCKLLEAQRDALMSLKALDKPNLAVEHLRNERRRKENQEKARLDVAVEDAATSITEQISDAQREIESGKSVLTSFLKERLASDDTILTALPNIVSKILTEVEASEDEQAVEQWCNAIISFRTAEIKARVDAVYLNSLAKAPKSELPEASESELREMKSALQAELETLHSEIASVAEMVVEHELRKPLTDMKELRAKDREQTRAAWLNYVLSTLAFMSRRFTTLTAHAETLTDFHQALNHIHAAALQRIPGHTHHAQIISPVKRHIPSKSSFHDIKLKSTKPLSLPAPLQDALRHAGVSFTQDSIAALQQCLLRIQLEREEKLAAHYESAGSETHNLLAERLGKADADAQAVLESLYKYSPFATMRMVDPGVEDLLGGLERDVREKEGELLTVETEGLSLSDPRVRRFVDKYGK